MKTLFLLTGFAALAFVPMAHSADAPTSETTKVVVNPVKTEVITTDTKTIVKTEGAVPTSTQTTVVIDKAATVVEPVDEVLEEEQDKSLRDRVRGKMKN